MARPSRRVVLVLAADEWDRLTEQAREQARDPFQQARWLVLRGLGVRRALLADDDPDTELDAVPA